MTTTTSRAITPAAPTSSNWQDRALCAETDPELFFPEGTGGTITNAEAQAKAVCTNCPVRPQCLDYALDTDQTWGVWGGKDRLERKALSKNRRTAAQTQETTLAEIVKEVQRGRNYLDIDRRRGQKLGTTATFVSRARKEYAAKGKEFPAVLQRAMGRLTSEQVRQVRERSAAGEKDLELAMAFDVTQRSIGAICRGERYLEAGGPIRRRRPNVPSVDSRVLWGGGQESFLKTAV